MGETVAKQLGCMAIEYTEKLIEYVNVAVAVGGVAREMRAVCESEVAARQLSGGSAALARHADLMRVAMANKALAEEDAVIDHDADLGFGSGDLGGVAGLQTCLQGAAHELVVYVPAFLRGLITDCARLHIGGLSEEGIDKQVEAERRRLAKRAAALADKVVEAKSKTVAARLAAEAKTTKSANAKAKRAEVAEDKATKAVVDATPTEALVLASLERKIFAKAKSALSKQFRKFELGLRGLACAVCEDINFDADVAECTAALVADTVITESEAQALCAFGKRLSDEDAVNLLLIGPINKIKQAVSATRAASAADSSAAAAPGAPTAPGAANLQVVCGDLATRLASFSVVPGAGLFARSGVQSAPLCVTFTASTDGSVMASTTCSGTTTTTTAGFSLREYPELQQHLWGGDRAAGDRKLGQLFYDTEQLSHRILGAYSRILSLDASKPTTTKALCLAIQHGAKSDCRDGLRATLTALPASSFTTSVSRAQHHDDLFEQEAYAYNALVDHFRQDAHLHESCLPAEAIQYLKQEMRSRAAASESLLDAAKVKLKLAFGRAGRAGKPDSYCIRLLDKEGIAIVLEDAPPGNLMFNGVCVPGSRHCAPVHASDGVDREVASASASAPAPALARSSSKRTAAELTRGDPKKAKAAKPGGTSKRPRAVSSSKESSKKPKKTKPKRHHKINLPTHKSKIFVQRGAVVTLQAVTLTFSRTVADGRTEDGIGVGTGRFAVAATFSFADAKEAHAGEVAEAVGASASSPASSGAAEAEAEASGREVAHGVEAAAEAEGSAGVNIAEEEEAAHAAEAEAEAAHAAEADAAHAAEKERKESLAEWKKSMDSYVPSGVPSVWRRPLAEERFGKNLKTCEDMGMDREQFLVLDCVPPEVQAPLRRVMQAHIGSSCGEDTFFIAACDPGLHTFCTVYSLFDAKVFAFGRNFARRSLVVERVGRAKQALGNSKAKYYYNAKLAKRKRGLHATVARFFTSCFHLLVMPPPLKTSHGQSSDNKFMTNHLGFAKFKQVMQQRAKWHPDFKLVEHNEVCSSMCCGKCGAANRRLGIAKTNHCRACGHKQDRDGGAARTILIKYLFEQRKTKTTNVPDPPPPPPTPPPTTSTTNSAADATNDDDAKNHAPTRSSGGRHQAPYLP